MDPLTPEDYPQLIADLRHELHGLRAHMHRLRGAALSLCGWASEVREHVDGTDDPATDGYAVCHHLRDAEQALNERIGEPGG